MTIFDPPQLENRSTDYDETWNLELSPEDHPACKTTYRCVNVGGVGEHPVCHCKFLSLPFFSFFFLFLQHAPRSQQWTDLHQIWHVSAVSAKDVPFGGLDDDQSRLGVLTPQKPKFWGRE